MRKLRTPLTLIILLTILGIAGWWGYNQVMAPIPPTPLPDCVNTQVKNGRISTSQVVVRVYNAGRIRGQASAATRELTQVGFRTRRPDDTSEKVLKTTIVGAKADSPEVKLVASFFKDVKITGDGRKDGTVDVIISEKYAMNLKASRTIAIKGTTACLPPPPTASPTAGG